VNPSPFVLALITCSLLSGCDPVYLQRIRVAPPAAEASASSAIRVREPDSKGVLRLLDRVARAHGFRSETPLRGSDAERGLAYYAQSNEPQHTNIQISVFLRPNGVLEIRTIEGYALHPSALTRDFTEALLSALRDSLGPDRVEVVSHWRD
jgi:hypothetical protein